MDHELQNAYETTIEGWMRALGLRDRQTEGHCLRVAELSLTFGKDLGFKDDELIDLRRGALLHDIGKMGTPDHILYKPDRLIEAEWEIVKRHTVYGHELLSPIPFLQPAAVISYCHHENWDGSGYPRGLKGESIPLIARIVSVCNVFDALVSDQPYRRAWDQKDALSYIEAVAGKQFDPEIIPAFLRLTQGKH
jgi:putative nucleotidyltransferase with HDIG domain